MGTLLQQLLAFPPHPSPTQAIPEAEYDKEAQKIVKTLRDTSGGKLTGPISGNDTILDIVNPSTHSLPYLFSLSARLEGKNTKLRTGTPLWQNVRTFIDEFDPVQVRYAGSEFRKLLEAIEGCAAQDSVIVIEALKTGIMRLDPTGATLTSSHVKLLRICLKAKAYSLVEPVLACDIYHVPTPVTKHPEREQPNIPLPCGSHATSSTFITTGSGLSQKMDYHDYLLYFLYGAMIYIGLWNWERAITFLEIVMTAPTSMAATSMLQVEAYKKWVLLNLLSHGKTPSMPRNVHNHSAKHFKALAKAYDVVSDAFKEPDPAKLKAEIKVGPFVADSNYSLALLVLSAHQRFKVQALSETYASIPLARVKSLAFPYETALVDVETYVRNLISNAQLPGASLVNPQSTTESSSSEIYLRFSAKNSLTISETDLYKSLVQQRSKVGGLAAHMKDTQRKIELSKEYVEALRRLRKQEAKGQKESQGSQSRLPGAFDDEMIADM